MTKPLLIFALIYFGLNQAHASLLIEPYGGGLAGTTVADSKLGNDYDAKLSGSVYGARLGFSILWLWCAVDYLGVSGSTKYNKPEQGDGSFFADNAFFDVGLDLPIIFRFWAGAGFFNTIKFRDKNTTTGVTDDVTFKGTSAVRAGLGFKLLSFFSINFEYFKPNYNKYDATDAPSDDVGKDFARLDNEMGFVTLSFPLSLF